MKRGVLHLLDSDNVSDSVKKTLFWTLPQCVSRLLEHNGDKSKVITPPFDGGNDPQNLNRPMICVHESPNSRASLLLCLRNYPLNTKFSRSFSLSHAREENAPRRFCVRLSVNATVETFYREILRARDVKNQLKISNTTFFFGRGERERERDDDEFDVDVDDDCNDSIITWRSMCSEFL